MRTIKATEAKNRFGNVLREVTQTGSPLLIERAGRPVAVILSLAAYQATCQPPALPVDSNDLARSAFGMWADRKEIDDTWLSEGRKAWNSRWEDA